MSAFRRAIIFDLDDTLYPEREYARSGLRAVAEAFAARLLRSSADLYARMCALLDTPDRGRIFDAIVAEQRAAEHGVADSAALVAEMIATYRGHTPVLSLYPDAEAVLHDLRGRAVPAAPPPSARPASPLSAAGLTGPHPAAALNVAEPTAPPAAPLAGAGLVAPRADVALGIISDGWREVQERKVRALGLEPRVDVILLTDAWGREFWKPHPRAFEEMSRRLAVPPEHCVYVADNPAKDFLAPNTLGWRTIRIARQEGLYSAVPAPAGGEPQATIGSLTELLSAAGGQ